MTEQIRWVKTHCARMDHGGCGLILGVEGNRIVKVKGDPDGFLNEGYVCPKGLASPERLTHPKRLKHPLRRTGKRGEGQWEKIPWSEALEVIRENLDRVKEKHGARAVAFCQGMPKGLEHFLLIRLANVFGSPNVVAVQDVCHAPREISGLHTCGFYPVTNFHYPSKLALVWGSNTTATNEEGEISSLLLKQVKAGTELIVVDPRKTDLARKAKCWLQLKPGSDHALALAFLNVIIEEQLYQKDFVEKWTYGFDEFASHVRAFSPERMAEVTWVPPELIRKAAETYATSHPAAIRWGNAVEHHAHNFDTIRALLCMMAVCGNLDVRGGNIQPNEPKTLGLGEFVRSDLIPSKRKEMIHAFHGTIPRLMTVPSAYFRKAVLEDDPYPVRAAYMQCTNPMLTYADTRKTFDALMKLDFLAVSEVFMTPTAALADIVLPAATHFEFDDIGHYGVGHGHVLARPKVVDPPEECWPDMKIINELGKSLTPAEYWHENYEDFLEDVLAPTGLSYAQFAEKGYLKGPDRFEKYLSSGFKTPTGKVELLLSQAQKLGLAPLPRFTGTPEPDDPDYPLVLASSKDAQYLHSSYRWVEKLRELSPQPCVEIHPDTAAKYGIRHGDQVAIQTRQGEIVQIANLTDRVHPKVIHVAYGWWFPEADAKSLYEWERANINVLTSVEKVGKEFGTPNLKGICCRIRKG